MTSKNALSDAKKLVWQNKKACLQNLCEIIHKKEMSNNGRMPYGYMSTLLKENRKSFDWLTQDTVNSAYARFKKRELEKSSVREQPTINVIHIDQLTKAGNSSRISDLSDSQRLLLSNIVNHQCEQKVEGLLDQQIAGNERRDRISLQ